MRFGVINNKKPPCLYFINCSILNKFYEYSDIQIHMSELREFMDLYVHKRRSKIFKIYIIKYRQGGLFLYTKY